MKPDYMHHPSHKVLTTAYSKLQKPILVISSFRKMIPPLSEMEHMLLKQSIARNGCREPLIVWPKEEGYYLIDGHNRWDICQELKQDFKVLFKNFKDEQEASVFMLARQLNRSNLSDLKKSYIRGMWFSKFRKGKDSFKQLASIETWPKALEVPSEVMAHESEVAHAIEKIGELNALLKIKLLAGNLSLSEEDIILAGKAIDQLKPGRLSSVKDIRWLIANFRHKRAFDLPTRPTHRTIPLSRMIRYAVMIAKKYPEKLQEQDEELLLKQYVRLTREMLLESGQTTEALELEKQVQHWIKR